MSSGAGPLVPRKLNRSPYTPPACWPLIAKPTSSASFFAVPLIFSQRMTGFFLSESRSASTPWTCRSSEVGLKDCGDEPYSERDVGAYRATRTGSVSTLRAGEGNEVERRTFGDGAVGGNASVNSDGRSVR